MAEDIRVCGSRGELAYRRVVHIMRSGAQAYGRVDEGGKGVRKPSEEYRCGRGGQGRGLTWGDRGRLDTFQGGVGWTVSRISPRHKIDKHVDRNPLGKRYP